MSSYPPKRAIGEPFGERRRAAASLKRRITPSAFALRATADKSPHQPLHFPVQPLDEDTVVLYDYSSHNAEIPVMREIQLRDAKASLSAVVDEAMRGEPAVITRHGKRQAVVVSYEEWERLTTVPSFGRLLMAAPLTAGDLPRRNNSPLRKSNI